MIGEKGGFAVTFFFIVSGYLIANSFDKKPLCSNENNNGLAFIVRKYRHYITWYLVAFIMCALLDATQNGFGSMLKNCLKSVPSLLLLGSVGYSSDLQSTGYYIGASWYLSALFISQILLYPFMRSDYRRYINNIAPLILIGTFAMSVAGYGNNIVSALFGISIGQFCYEAVRYTDKCMLSGRICMALRIIEAAIYLLCFVFMSVEGFDDLNYGMTFVTALAVAISFSAHCEYRLFDKPVFTFLGQISFPMYLLHIQISKWSDYLVKQTLGLVVNDRLYYPCLYICIILLSALAYLISVKISNRKAK